jgi:integrase
MRAPRRITRPRQEESAVKLLEQVRHVARLRRLALPAERCYVCWVEHYIRFHKTAERFRHPAALGADAVERFLTFLAVQRRVSASTQNQAFAALLFLYRDVLHLDLGDIDALRARRTRRMPVVLTTEEVARLLAALDGLPTREPYGLMARLMYGPGVLGGCPVARGRLSCPIAPRPTWRGGWRT